MAIDPGPAPITLEPGSSATSELGWDASDGRTLIGAVWIAPYQGVTRTVLPADFDITAEADGVNASDEAGLVERLGHDVHVVLGSERNMKITRPADMELARFYLEQERQKK